MSAQNSLVLLNRILSLKDGLPFLLAVDTLEQSAFFLVQEIAYRASNETIYLSFETVNKPQFSSHFIDCMDLAPEEIVKNVKQLTSNDKGVASVASAAKKTLIIVDSLNSIPIHQVANFVTSLISPTTVVLGIFHDDFGSVSSKYPNFPSHRKLLNYIASSVFEIEPHHKTDVDQEELDNDLNKLKIPALGSLNSPVFKITLINRRKSGRSITSKFIINTVDHDYQHYKESEDTVDPEDESMLKDLTTFNLTTSLKQKLAKEQVELPFMQAQEELGSYSGAIVYEFEKDDDYDEEDPYEDPF